MKDSEFIELLNLYLDHEISEPDAARLEAEVQSNAERCRIYQQYCRMQKACRMLTADFAEEIDGVPQRKVVPFDAAAATATRGLRFGGFRLAGAFAAAAACVAVIFVVSQNREQGSTVALTEPAGVTQAAPATTRTAEPAMAVAVDTSALVPARSEPQQPARRTIDPLLLNSQAQAEVLLANAVPHETEDQFAWIRTLQVSPLRQPVSAETLRFDVRPRSLRPEGRGFRSAPAEADVEMTAFQIQK